MEDHQGMVHDPLAGSQQHGPTALPMGYAPPGEGWDEMAGADGGLRSHWQGLIAFLSSLPRAEMARRWDLGLRLIRENGVTYNAYDDAHGLDRPWRLDPLPLILTAEEWRGIEAALIQRAVLLNRILADLYGPRELMARGLVPPALVLAHPGYLRPLRRASAPAGVPLPLYAADIARGPDGRWQVIVDRTEAPSGVGYALENRSILGRMLADRMRARPVRPLTPFLQAMRECLLAATPRRRAGPRIVLLTPGPYNESYFEHAYLARHLGYTLVESEDLTMRDGRVWLKTLDGLQPIDVILRRTSGAYCDPLELRGDSLLGVTGLAQAARAGTVIVANALGSGVLEGGGLAPFLPELARQLLGEDLRMPSVNSWWCGRPGDRQHVLGHLDQLVVKRMGSEAPWFGQQLAPERLADLRTAILRQPYAYVAQEHTRLSTVPVRSDGGLAPRPMMLRVFLAADGGSYVAMPGGLTRFAAERAGTVVSAQAGGGSKDTWVLAEKSERLVSRARSSATPARLVHGAADLPSRVADNLFWFGRYLERSENNTRLLRAALSRAGHSAGFGATEELPVVSDLLRTRFRVPPGLTDEETVTAIVRIAFEVNHADAPGATVERVYTMASLARDRLSFDTWRAVNSLREVVGAIVPGPALHLDDALNALHKLVLGCEALSGLIMENMTRGPAWHFLDIGRRLERSIHMVDLAAGVLAHPGKANGAALDTMLEISDSAMTYRARYLSAPEFAPVLDLLVADESNPRSLGFQIAALAGHMDYLAALRRSVSLTAEQRLTVWLSGAVRTADVTALSTPDEDGERRNLAGFLEVLRTRLWELSEVVTREYFTLAASRGAESKTAKGHRR